MPIASGSDRDLQATAEFDQSEGSGDGNRHTSPRSSNGDTRPLATVQFQPDPTSIVEALLFVGGGQVGPADVARIVRGLSDQEAEGIIRNLADRYCQQGRPYEIVALQGGYVLRLRRSFQRAAQRLRGRERSVHLSRAAIDVLALIAYRQPVGRRDLDSLRGMGSTAILRQLLRLGLLRLVREQAPSREVTYSTTDRFLRILSLSSPQDLPQPTDLEKL